MWSLTTGVRRFGLLVLVTCGALCLQAPAFANGLGRGPNDRWMDGTGVAVGTAIDLVTQPPPLPPTEPNATVPHQFSLACDVTSPRPAGGWNPDFLVIRWDDLFGNHYTFNLKTLTSSTCSPPPMAPSFLCDPIMDPILRDGCFDKIVGAGTGSLKTTGPYGEPRPTLPNCSNCGSINFTFRDNGPAKTGNPFQTGVSDDGEFFLDYVTTGPNLLLFGCTDCPGSSADYVSRKGGRCFFNKP